MSTAFMVDNILNDKDEQTDTLSIVSGSGSDSDSEQNSDLKDSLCDSPKSYNSVNNHNSSLSDDDHIRPYTILNDSNRMDMLMEYCCAKCGHYQSTAGTTIPTSPNANNNNNCNNNNNVKNNISSITMTGDGSHKIQRPRSVILEPDRVVELKRGHNNHHHNHGGGGKIRGKKFSSTESMTTSSSGGSMESLKSSTSEGNRSTTSSESHHSSSLSSHSSDSGPSLSYPLRAPALLHTKLHILSPISDKSAQEQASELADMNSSKNAGSQMQSPDNGKAPPEETESLKTKKRLLPNKTLLILSGEEIQGSDSGISLHSRDDTKIKSAFQSFELHKLSQNIDKIQKDSQDINDLPFDMPKLRRRRGDLQQDFCTSGSATSVDLGELPFDMPKLRRRIRQTQTQIAGGGISSGILNLPQTSTESSGLSQASSSQSVRDDKPMLETGVFRQNLTLNLNESKKFASLDLHGVGMASGGGLDTGRNKGLKLNLGINTSIVDLIDITIPLERQGWYHGAISRIEAENTLRSLNEGSFLVRDSESTRQDYSLSLKSAKGFMHMRIQRDKEFGRFILGQFSRPFETIPEMIKHFCLNRLPVRGAEHMCLLEPVIAQLL